MKTLLMAAFGWLVPGGAYLLMRRYLQFAMFAIPVAVAVVAGFALGGVAGWPQPAELTGLDGFTALLFRAGAAAKVLAGAPFFAACLLHGPGDFLGGRVHEFGTTLLMLAGLLNLLAVSSALDLKKGPVK